MLFDVTERDLCISGLNSRCEERRCTRTWHFGLIVMIMPVRPMPAKHDALLVCSHFRACLRGLQVGSEQSHKDPGQWTLWKQQRPSSSPL